MRLFIYLFVWLTSTFFESWHDWQLHSKLYKPDALPKDKDWLKALDSFEKIIFLVGITSIEFFYFEDDLLYITLFVIWQAWLRWFGHELWYSLFSHTSFGKFGTTSFLDRFLNKLKIQEDAMVWILVTPPVVLFLILSTWL